MTSIDSNLSFSVVDYIIFFLMLFISLCIGFVSWFKGKNTTDDFSMAGRSFGPYTVSMSLVTSYISSIGILGFSGETYGQGIQPAMNVIGLSVGSIITAHTVLNVLYPLKLTSVNEYFELRFESSAMRKVMMIIQVISNVLYLGVCVYTPTLAMSIVMPIDNMYHVYILVTVCTFYSALGGIRAVVWTDVFQLTVVVIGLTITLAIGCLEVGGFWNVLNVAYDRERLNLFNTSFDLQERHTMWNTFFNGIALFFIFSINQINVQRMCSIRSIRDAKKSLYMNAIGYILVYFLIFGSALAAFTVYSDCDPYMTGKITKKEQILPYFIADKGRYVVCLAGLFIATLVGSTLSTVSSMLNAMSCIFYEDILKQLPCLRGISEKHAAYVTRGATVMFGGITIGMTFLARDMSSVISASLTITGVSMGPVLGVFLLGICWPRCGIKGAYIGLILSTIITGWLAFGAYIYRPPSKLYPMSVSECPINRNVSIILQSDFVQGSSNRTLYYPTLRFNSYTEYEKWFDGENAIKDPPTMMPLYTISYTLYSIIGPILCFFIGVVVTIFTGSNDVEKMNPNLVLPCLRRYFFPCSSLENSIQLTNINRTTSHLQKLPE